MNKDGRVYPQFNMVCDIIYLSASIWFISVAVDNADFGPAMYARFLILTTEPNGAVIQATTVLPPGTVWSKRAAQMSVLWQSGSLSTELSV